MADTGGSPFVGLRPFDVGDQGRFFGRAREVAALTRAIRSHAFTAVIGASGSGKSSLVRAGVLPQLERADWQFLITTPGTQPIARLSRELALLVAVGDDPLGETRRYHFDMALRASAFGLADVVRPLVPDAAGLVLVIDQFEELFRYGEEARGAVAAAMREESRAYVELLLTAARTCSDRLRIVITMRSDYFGNCAAYAGLAEAVSQSQYLVPVPVRDQLEQAIREPLALSGATIDDALVQRLLVDVEEETDRLPLLQHTLRRLWEGARGDPKHLSEADYAAVGRLAGSIDVKAEALASQLAGDRDHPEGGAALERVMKAVTALDERGRATRRLSSRGELIDLLADADEARRPAAAGSVDRVLGALQAEDTSFVRLTPGDSDVEVDIGHEALIRSWKRLAGPALDYTAGWLSEERQDGDRWRHLLDGARGDSWLMPWDWWRHRRWMTGHNLSGTWAERYGGGWDRVQAWGRKWFRRVGGGVLSGGLLFIALVGVLLHYALDQRKQTREQLKNLAAMTVGYAGNYAKDESRIAALMALEVLSEERVENSDVASKAQMLLADALARPIETMRIKVGSPVASAAFSPDGMRIVTGSEDGAARVWSSDGTSDPLILKGHGRWVNSVAFSPDGTRIATASDDRKASVWRADGTGEPVVFKRHGYWVWSATFSPDGRRIVTASEDGTAWVWRADGAGEPVFLDTDLFLDTEKPVIRDQEKPAVKAASFSPDGTRIATGSSDGIVRVWLADRTGGAFSFKPENETGACVPRETSRNSKSEDSEAGKKWASRPWYLGALSVAFSPDGVRLAAGCSDNTAQVWHYADKADGVVLRGHTGPIMSLAFSPDGVWIVTASLDGTARVWPADGRGESLVLKGHTDWLRSAAFSPDGTQIVTGSIDGTVRVWRVEEDTPLFLKGHEEEVRSVAFSPDGKQIVTASTDDTAWVWRTDGAGEPMVLKPGGGDVNSAAFSPDGTRIVMALDDNTARVVRADGGGELLRLEGHEGFVSSAQFSPDGARIVTASTDGKVRIWRADAPGEPTIVGEYYDWIWSVEFSRDGSRIVLALDDKTARVVRSDGGGELAVLKGHDARVMTASFSPDGMRIVTGSSDNTARVWRADGTGDPLPLIGHEDQVTSAAFTEDGTRIVTGSWDGTIRVWDSNSKEPIGKPRSVRDVASVSAVDMSPDGQWIAFGSSDGVVGRWTGGPALAPVSANRDAARSLCPLDRVEREALHMPKKEEPLTPTQRLACGASR